MGRTWKARVDEHNRLVLPQELAKRFMLETGQDLEIVEENGTWTIARPVSQLARVYVEPTNLCNLDCRTCMRNVWDEPLGRMSMQVAERIFQQLSEIDPTPEVFFGGYGEPLAHAQIVDMVRLAKAAGARVELITNGTLLSERMEHSLIDAGLDFLWVSLDGANAKSYADVRLGAALPEVIENIRRMGRLKEESGRYLPELGIAFVAMKRNIRDLPEIVRLAKELGARKLSVSHVLAHHSGLRREVLYEKTMYTSRNRTGTLLEISMPRMDATAETAGIRLALEMEEGVVVNGRSAARQAAECPFVGKGSLSIRWDGKISPCLPLLHSHESYLDRHTRKTESFVCGDILDADLLTIWKAGPYHSLRKKIQSYDYSPCVLCNTCEMSAANVEDCFGNIHPTCGGCLWAHGLIQCP